MLTSSKVQVQIRYANVAIGIADKYRCRSVCLCKFCLLMIGSVAVRVFAYGLIISAPSQSVNRKLYIGCNFYLGFIIVS